MPDDFVVARNPDGDSRLPYLLRIPLGAEGVILKARESWPRTAKVYCHRVDEWPEDAEVVERVPVRSCVRPGAAVDLVLDRGRENRSQLVFTQIGDDRRSSGRQPGPASRRDPGSAYPPRAPRASPTWRSWSTAMNATATPSATGR